LCVARPMSDRCSASKLASPRYAARLYTALPQPTEHMCAQLDHKRRSGPPGT
jgi:hypothetical protein